MRITFENKAGWVTGAASMSGKTIAEGQREELDRMLQTFVPTKRLR
jgi:hypothetical protein